MHVNDFILLHIQSNKFLLIDLKFLQTLPLLSLLPRHVLQLPTLLQFSSNISGANCRFVNRRFPKERLILLISYEMSGLVAIITPVSFTTTSHWKNHFLIFDTFLTKQLLKMFMIPRTYVKDKHFTLCYCIWCCSFLIKSFYSEGSENLSFPICTLQVKVQKS